jgi:hypothetical protein
MKGTSISALALAVTLVASTALAEEPHHATAKLEPVGDSHVTGVVNITAMPGGGTMINIVARGLDSGTEYLSLYYENGTCQLEPYSEDDVIARYTPNPGGVATVNVKSEEDFDEIHSISVRVADGFALKSCASFGEEEKK